MQITADKNGGRCAPCADNAVGGTRFRYWKNLVGSSEIDKAEFERLDRHGLGALHWAISKGDQRFFQSALEAGVHVDQLTAHCKLAPLHFAAEQENPCFLEILIERGASLNQPDWKGWAPLHYAAESGLVDHARKLVEAGCCLRPLGRHRQSPFDVAFFNARIEIIEYLAGLDGARHRSWSKRLPFAVQQGQPNVVRWLLHRGANPDTKKGGDGRACLEIAKRPFPIEDHRLNGCTEEQIAILRSNHRQVIELIENALDQTDRVVSR